MSLYLTRRSTLLASVGFLSTVSGCTGESNEVNTQPNQRADSNCEDADRWSGSYDRDNITARSSGGFVVSASPDTIEIGEQITFRLENKTNEVKETGESSQFNIEKRRDDSCYGVFTEGGPFDAALTMHEPGDGFDWMLTFTENEIDGTRKPLCGSLEPGTYRFVYFGISVEDAGPGAMTFSVQKQ